MITTLVPGSFATFILGEGDNLRHDGKEHVETRTSRRTESLRRKGCLMSSRETAQGRWWNDWCLQESVLKHKTCAEHNQPAHCGHKGQGCLTPTIPIVSRVLFEAIDHYDPLYGMEICDHMLMVTL